MDLMQGLKTFLVAAVAMGASYLNSQFGWINISAEECRARHSSC